MLTGAKLLEKSFNSYMVRFKDWELADIELPFKVSIPIWFDLKAKRVFDLIRQR